MFDIRLIESICVDLRQIYEWWDRPIGTYQKMTALFSAKTIRRYLLPKFRKQILRAFKLAETDDEREELLKMVQLELLLTYEEWRKAWFLMQMLGVEDSVFTVTE